jgi:hypothetical protein
MQNPMTSDGFSSDCPTPHHAARGAGKSTKNAIPAAHPRSMKILHAMPDLHGASAAATPGTRFRKSSRRGDQREPVALPRIAASSPALPCGAESLAKARGGEGPALQGALLVGWAGNLVGSRSGRQEQSSHFSRQERGLAVA